MTTRRRVDGRHLRLPPPRFALQRTGWRQPSRVGEFARRPDDRRSLTGQASEGWLANGRSLTGPGERFVGLPNVAHRSGAGLPSEAPASVEAALLRAARYGGHPSREFPERRMAERVGFGP